MKQPQHIKESFFTPGHLQTQKCSKFIPMENPIEHIVRLVLDREEENNANRDTQRRPSIHMVPSKIRDSNGKFYTPQMVSIGPLHRGDVNLQRFERRKAACVKRLLMRYGCVQQTFEECLQKVASSIVDIRACYAEEIILYNDDELAKMMLVDGCFIISIFDDYDFNQVIIHHILFDLFLIENQIPFFVLEYIFQCTFVKCDPNASLVDLLKPLLKCYYIFKGDFEIWNFNEDTKPDHILGLAHHLYQPKDTSFVNVKPFETVKFHSATELDRAGVKFQPNDAKNWAMAMEVKFVLFSWFPWFNGKPLLKMPVLMLVDRTELILRNLLMHEQLNLIHDNMYVLSYLCTMDLLIDTPEDVSCLKISGILVNVLGSDEMAAAMINNICKESFITYSFYGKEFESLDGYYNEYWPNMIAELKRKYFTSPWTMIALLAGISLFVLTVVQTIYAVIK